LNGDFQQTYQAAERAYGGGITKRRITWPAVSSSNWTLRREPTTIKCMMPFSDGVP
jgi:hypothetical protein